MTPGSTTTSPNGTETKTTTKKDSMEKESLIKVKTRGTPVAESLKYRLVGDEMVNLTRSLAFQLLEMDTFSAERPVRERWVQFLYDEWRAGRFLWHQAMVAWGVINLRGADETIAPHNYRLNGQHTCWMRVSIPKELEPKGPCKVRQLVYECADLDGLRDIYSVIDRNAQRTNAHIAKVLLSDSQPCSAIPISYLNSLLSGLRLWMWESPEERRMRGSPQEMAAIVQVKYPELFHIVSQYFSLKYIEWIPIRRSGIIAALFATFHKSGAQAADFWDKVCSGLGLDSKTDPRYQLRQFCVSHGSTYNAQYSIGAEDTYRIAINLWNKWREGEPVQAVRPLESRVKIK